MPRGNPENLVPNSQRTPEERKENASKAGRASGEARRKQRDLREALKFLQKQKITTAYADDPRAMEIMAKLGLNADDSVAMLTAASILTAAISGNAQMAKIVADLCGIEESKPSAPAKVIVQFEDNREEFNV